MEVALGIALAVAFLTVLVVGVIGVFKSRINSAILAELTSELARLRAQIQQPPDEKPKAVTVNKPASKPVKPDAIMDPTGPWEKSAVAAVAARGATVSTSPTLAPPPKTLPTGPSFITRLIDNFKANWVIWIAALSLALGGTFIVQYGLEQGLLGPTARVIVSLFFGLALVVAAEYLRRKTSATGAVTVPAALAAGGVATLFAAVVSAHSLYGLTNALFGFISMALVSWLALAGGLIFGPVLAVIGLLGAFLSPVLVNTDVPPPPLMYLYFLGVLAASLYVERWQRWIWLSALAVGLAIFQGIALTIALPGDPFLAAYLGVVMILVTTVPAFGVPPRWADSTVVHFKSILHLSKVYPTVLTFVTALTVTLVLLISTDAGIAHWQTALLALTVLMIAAVFLNARAQNLDQLPPIFAAGLIATVAVGPLQSISFDTIQIEGETVSALRPYFPWAANAVGFAIVTFLIAAIWRTPRSTRPNFWIWLAALTPLIALPVFWASWHTINPLGNGGWAYIGLLVAAVQTGMALMLHRQKDRFPLGSDAFSVSVLVLLLMVAIELFDGIPLSFAIALLALAAVGLEVRFGFVNVARLLVALVGLIMARLVLFPGIDWAMDARWGEFATLYAGSILLLAAGALHAAKANRAASFLVFETATMAAIAISLSIGVAKLIAAGRTPEDLLSVGLIGSIWGILALVQMRRMVLFDAFLRVRQWLAGLYGGIFVLATITTVTYINPLATGAVQGPLLFDALAVAYVLPALVLAGLLRIPSRFAFLTSRRIMPAAVFLLALYGTLEIRRFWHGPIISDGTILTEELYTYTIAMLIITVGTFIASILQDHRFLRTTALSLAAITALKVFLWDMSGLQGLGRASAFIGLGLTLAGIAWLHQRFQIKSPQPKAKPD